MRWRLALLGMDRLLDDLGLNGDQRRELLSHARDALRTGFAIDADALRRLCASYRSESGALAALLKRNPASGQEWQAARTIFDRRSLRNAAPASALQEQSRLGRLSSTRAELVGSLLHMSVNRLLRNAHRAHELVLYDFLYRFYDGQAARQKNHM